MPECLACPGGWASANSKSLQCDSCLAGSACSAASRFPFNCPAGWISAEDRSTSCIACPAGKAADGDNNVMCTTCKPGLYSSMENSSVCESCMRGQYAPNELSLRCAKCPQGWSINATDSPSCLHCAKGNQSYPSRPPGSTDNGPSGGTSCISCKLGWIQTPQTRTCWMCYTGFYSLYRGEELPTEFATDKVGYEDNAHCHLCPEGAECLGGHRVKALNSWWRSSNMSVSLTQCFEHAACLGARNPNSNVDLEKAVAEKENNETCAVG